MSDIPETVALATDIVSAFVSNNKVAAGELPDMIAQVYKALDDVAKGDQAARGCDTSHACGIHQEVDHARSPD